MPGIKVEPIRINNVVTTPLRIWSILVIAVLAVIIAINAD